MSPPNTCCVQAEGSPATTGWKVPSAPPFRRRRGPANRGLAPLRSQVHLRVQQRRSHLLLFRFLLGRKKRRKKSEVKTERGGDIPYPRPRRKPRMFVAGRKGGLGGYSSAWPLKRLLFRRLSEKEVEAEESPLGEDSTNEEMEVNVECSSASLPEKREGGGVRSRKPPGPHLSRKSAPKLLDSGGVLHQEAVPQDAKWR